METLEAGILKTVFRNEENGYSVITVRAGRSEYTVVGVLPELAPGEQAVFSGEWTEHKNYGRQFHCSSCTIQEPTSRLGIERYLASGLIRGIRASTAALIVARFGEETLSILSEHPERLTEIPGIGKKRCAMIAESFQEQQTARQAIIFLQSYGVPASLAMRISKRYGDQAAEAIRENPYRLCDDLEGVGFKTADRIGLSLGIPADSPNRVRCALKYLLREAAASAGHVYLPESELCAQAGSLLQTDPGLCATHLKALLVSGELIAECNGEDRDIFLSWFYRAEAEVALRLRQLALSAAPDPVPGAARAVSAFERKNRIRFSPTQRQAILEALRNGVFVITGGPGTGKTTIINCILDLLSEGEPRSVPRSLLFVCLRVSAFWFILE